MSAARAEIFARCLVVVTAEKPATFWLSKWKIVVSRNPRPFAARAFPHCPSPCPTTLQPPATNFPYPINTHLSHRSPSSFYCQESHALYIYSTDAVSPFHTITTTLEPRVSKDSFLYILYIIRPGRFPHHLHSRRFVSTRFFSFASPTQHPLEFSILRRYLYITSGLV